MSEQQYLTRKDLARRLQVTKETVADNEKRWGLTSARRDFNSRVIRYDAALAEKALQRYKK